MVWTQAKPEANLFGGVGAKKQQPPKAHRWVLLGTLPERRAPCGRKQASQNFVNRMWENLCLAFIGEAGCVGRSPVQKSVAGKKGRGCKLASGLQRTRVGGWGAISFVEKESWKVCDAALLHVACEVFLICGFCQLNKTSVLFYQLREPPLPKLIIIQGFRRYSIPHPSDLGSFSGNPGSGSFPTHGRVVPYLSHQQEKRTPGFQVQCLCERGPWALLKIKYPLDFWHLSK